MSVTQTLFMQEPGDTSAVSINDVNQGWLGDCFLCAPIAALALERPDYIQNMIRDNGDGTQSVRLYFGTLYSNIVASPFAIASDNSAWITVRDTDLGTVPGMNSNNGGQLIVNGVQEIWPQVIENAIAQVAGGYDKIFYGGVPQPIMQELTGNPATETYIFSGASGTSQPTSAQLQSDLAAKDMVTFSTRAPDNYGLVASHVYTLTKVDAVNGVDYAYFRNPWGYDDPQPVPVSDLGKEFVAMDVGTVPASPMIPKPLPSPTIKTVTGNRDGGVTLAGTSQAGTIINVTDTVAGRVNILGTTTTSSNGAWQFTSHALVNTALINTFTVNAQNVAGLTSAQSSALFLESTGIDTVNATAGVSEVFAIMSFRGSDVINGFQTSAVSGQAHDYINFSGRGITSFNQVQSMMSGTTSTVINIGSGKTITLANVAPSLLSASDFRYS